MDKHKDDLNTRQQLAGHTPLPENYQPPLVLYIEEDEYQTQLVERTLEHIPETRFISLLPTDAVLNIVLKEKPDLVLINLNLKGGMAFILMDQLKNHPMSRLTPVLGLCNSGKFHEAEKARRAGVKQCLSQPIKIYEFFETINAEIESILLQKKFLS